MVFTFNLKVKVAEQEVFEALDQVVLCAAGFGIDDEQQNLLRLSLEELLLNVCHHSGLPSNAVVDVALVLRDGVLRLTITDSGPSFDPLARAAPDLDLPIEDLDLSERPRNCLKRAQINSIGELLTKTEDDLLNITNFGQKSLDEVKQKLDERGLTLRG